MSKTQVSLTFTPLRLSTRRVGASRRRVASTRRGGQRQQQQTNHGLCRATRHRPSNAIQALSCWWFVGRASTKRNTTKTITTNAARISYSSQHTQHKQTEISVLTIKAQLCYRAFPLIRFCPLTCPKQSFCFILIFEGPGGGSSGSS